MVQARPRFKTIEEYAALDTSDLPECPYELVDGEIIEMGAEADQNLKMTIFLISVLLQFVPYSLIRKGAEVEVSSRSVTSRFPDLMVLTPEADAALTADQRSIITLTMPPPALVVEVVSPGPESSSNYQRDYVEKPQEYAARGIPEYWRIDPSRDVVAVLLLDGTAYQVHEFRGSDRVISPQFNQLALTAKQILKAGQ
jgi:Uma2 family endonuclease